MVRWVSSRAAVSSLLALVLAFGAALAASVVPAAAATRGPAPSTPPECGSALNAKDFPTIQAALDTLQSTGGCVHIPAGIWLLPAKVRVYSNVTVYGDGMDRTVLKFEKGVEDHMMSNASLSKGNTNISVRDLTETRS